MEASEIPGESWTDKLKYAFDEAMPDGSGQISMSQWLSSRIPVVFSLIVNHPIRSQTLFFQIDTNCDNFVSLKDMVDYAVTHKDYLSTLLLESRPRLEYVCPQPMPHLHKCSACLRAILIPSLDQLAVLREESLTFFTVRDCEPIRSFSENESFVDFVYIPSYFRLAIVKSNRQIIFYDLKTFSKIHFFISASIDPATISRMTLEEAKQTLATKSQPLLFNGPTAIEAFSSNLLVGDSLGFIEVISVIPSGKPEYIATRLSSSGIHHSTVSQIRFIDALGCFASSSFDGSIAIWKLYNGTVNTLEKFSGDLPIVRFSFDINTRTFLFSTNVRKLGAWRTSSTFSRTIDVPNLIISINCMAISEDKSIVISIDSAAEVIIYSLPSIKEINRFVSKVANSSLSFSIDQSVFIAGNFLSLWRLETHGPGESKYSFISIVSNDVYKQFACCDEKGSVFIYDFSSGALSNAFSIERSLFEVNSFKIDESGRRFLIGFSDGAILIVSASNGEKLFEISKQYSEGGCSSSFFATIEGMNRIFCISGSKALAMFDESGCNEYSFIRTFSGHTEQICLCIPLKGAYVLSVGMEKEVFIWSPKSDCPVERFSLPIDISSACDIFSNDSLFLLGGSDGTLFLMSIGHDEAIGSIRPFPKDKCQISSISSSRKGAIFCANFHGLAARISLNGDKLQVAWRVCSHDCPIIDIAISDEAGTVVDLGRNNQMFAFSSRENAFIGKLGDSSYGKLIDRQSHAYQEEEEKKEKKPDLFSDTESESDDLVYEPMTETKKTFVDFQSLSEEIENVFRSGEDLRADAESTLKRNVSRQPAKYAAFEQLIQNSEMEKLSQSMSKLSSRRG